MTKHQHLTLREYRQIEAARKRRRAVRGAEPEVGIWWDDGQRLVIFSDPLSQADRTSRWANGHLDHWRAWPAIARLYDRCGQEDEYASIPRGRVVYDTRQDQAVIYHGSTAMRERLELVAREFGLRQWTARLDIHYEQTVPEAEFDELSDDAAGFD